MEERRSSTPAVALGLAMFLPAFGTHGLNAAQASIAAALRIDPNDGFRIGLVMAVCPIASVVAYLLVGAWGDRVGLRRGLLFGAVLYAASHVLILASTPLSERLALPPWILFLGLRVVVGFAGGAISVTANGLGAALYPPGQRGRSLSFVWLGVPLALVVGTPLPAFLSGPWAAMPAGARRWLADPYAAVALAVALLVLLLVPAAVPPAPARTRDEAAADAEVPPLRRSWSILLTSLLMPLAVFELLSSSAPYTHSSFHFTPAQQGLLFVFLGFGSVAGGVFSGAIADRLGRRRCLLVSLGLFALIVPTLPWCGALGYQAVATLLGFISTMRQGPFQALASYYAGDGGRGRFSAQILTASAFGISLGQFLGSDLLGRAGLPAVAWSSAAASACAFACARPLREPAARTAP